MNVDRMTILWFVVSLCVPTVVSAHEGDASPTNVDWLTGNELDRSCQVGITGTWADAPIRSLSQQVSERKRIPLFIDRRVDPSIPIQLASKNLTWEQWLYAIGNPHGYGFCRLEGLYYFGPKRTAICLPGQYEQINRWIGKNRKGAKVNWKRPVESSWPSLSQPDEMLVDLASEFQIEIVNDGKLPFDVWPESLLPDQPLVIKSLLLTVGFDRWIKVSQSGSKLMIVNFPKPEKVTFEFRNLVDSKNAARELESEFRGTKFKSTGRKRLEASGSLADIEDAFGRVLSYQRVAVGAEPNQAEPTFTAELKGSRGSILATMAQQLSIQLKFSPEIRSVLEQHVEFDVKDSTAREIIDQSLTNTGLRFRITGSELQVFK